MGLSLGEIEINFHSLVAGWSQMTWLFNLSQYRCESHNMKTDTFKQKKRQYYNQTSYSWQSVKEQAFLHSVSALQKSYVTFWKINMDIIQLSFSVQKAFLSDVYIEEYSFYQCPRSIFRAIPVMEICLTAWCKILFYFIGSVVFLNQSTSPSLFLSN